MLSARASQRGAMSLLLVAWCAGLLLAGATVTQGMAVVATDERAQSLADAAAHAAAVELIGDPRRDEISLLVQGDAAACAFAGEPPGDGGSRGVDPLCDGALAAARAVVTLSPEAGLVELIVHADGRDQAVGTGAGRLSVLAQVVLPRHLALAGRLCGREFPRGGALCWAQAWSEARRT